MFEREDLELCTWGGEQKSEVSHCAILGFLLMVWRVSVDDPPLWILAASGMLTFRTQPKMSFLISQLGSILFCFLECSCVHLSCRFRLALNSQFSCLSLLSAWITDEGQNIQFDQEFFYKILLFFLTCLCVCLCVCECGFPRRPEASGFPGARVIESCEPPNMGAGSWTQSSTCSNNWAFSPAPR